MPIADPSEEYSQKCIPSYFCDNNSTIDWHIDTEADITLDNWMKSYKLYCSGSTFISLIGTFFFIGFAVMSPILPPLSDKYGRRNFFLAALLVNAGTFVGVLVVPGDNIDYFYVIIALWFLSGCQTAARTVCGYNYMVEFAPKKYHTLMGTIWNVLESTTYIFLTLYFRFVSKKW